MKKIMATFMHESELGPAISIFEKDKNYKETPSFLMGSVDEKDITELKRLGLIVTEIEENQSILTPGKFLTYVKSKNFINPLQKIKVDYYFTIAGDDSISKEDMFYILTINGPLIVEYMDVLRSNEIELIDRIPDESYTAYLSAFQFDLVSHNVNN